MRVDRGQTDAKFLADVAGGLALSEATETVAFALGERIELARDAEREDADRDVWLVERPHAEAKKLAALVFDFERAVLAERSNAGDGRFQEVARFFAGVFPERIADLDAVAGARFPDDDTVPV